MHASAMRFFQSNQPTVRGEKINLRIRQITAALAKMDIQRDLIPTETRQGSSRASLEGGFCRQTRGGTKDGHKNDTGFGLHMTHGFSTG